MRRQADGADAGGAGSFYVAGHVQGIPQGECVGDKCTSAWVTTPIPGAAFLFAPALLGLFGLRRWQRKGDAAAA